MKFINQINFYFKLQKSKFQQSLIFKLQQFYKGNINRFCLQYNQMHLSQEILGRSDGNVKQTINLVNLFYSFQTQRQINEKLPNQTIDVYYCKKKKHMAINKQKMQNIFVLIRSVGEDSFVQIYKDKSKLNQFLQNNFQEQIKIKEIENILEDDKKIILKISEDYNVGFSFKDKQTSVILKNTIKQLIRKGNSQIIKNQQKKQQLKDQKIKSLQEQIGKQSVSIKEKQQLIQKLIAQIQLLKNQKAEILVQKQELKQQIQNLLNINNILQVELGKIKKLINQKQTKIKKIQQIDIQLKGEDSNQQKIRILKNNLLKEIYEKQKYINQCELLKGKSQSLAIQLESSECDSIFTGDILSTQQDYKKYVKKQIQKYTKSKIKRTRLIYQYDPLNSVNFHNYIDGITDLFIVIKTVNQILLAAFSKGALSPKNMKEQGGIIFSLTNHRVFFPFQGKRAVTYSELYLIFGNSQVRIRSNDNNLFSNFGVNNCNYNNNGYKVDVLLKQDTKRQVLMESYEIYQIVYK